MAKDYFQDILPPSSGRRPVSINTPNTAPAKRPVARLTAAPAASGFNEDDDSIDAGDAPMRLDTSPERSERSIRNISAPARRPRDDFQDQGRSGSVLPSAPRRASRIWLWIITGIAVIVVVSLLLVALRGTSVTVIPRSHSVVFDEASRLTAVPAGSAATGTLSYTVQTLEFEDAETVKSTGVVTAEEKASGSIIVMNDSSDEMVRLIKNTRFEGPGGTIFRIPADIMVPGKKGATAGKVTVTVIAENAGAEYNIPPSKLTLPGLKGTADYTKIYAQSSEAMTGGFKGERPGVSESDLEGAKATVRARLEKKIREEVGALSTGGITAFPELAVVTYQDLSTASETAGSARIGQKATVRAVLMPTSAFALAVARTVSAEAENASIGIRGVKDFGALPIQSPATNSESESVIFGLTGQAILVWDVDAEALAQALAGRDQSAFQTVVTTFPGIQSATARIEPFWASSFPDSASNIRVKIVDPSSQ